MQEIAKEAAALLPNIETKITESHGTLELLCKPEEVPRLCYWLFNEGNYHFCGLVVEENDQWDFYYLFAGEGEKGLVLVRTSAPLEESRFESLSVAIHAADWHEREAEDLFGLVFQGHPRLGDFILHDDAWQEEIAPMRKAFNPMSALSTREPREEWQPRRIVEAPGAFIMPIGPIFSGEAESVHFQLETIGEEVIRVFPRLFFKYRGVEKMAEGRSIDHALLIAERFAGQTAFSHALAFSMAIEKLLESEVPARAQRLRCFFAELERLRSHLGTIEGICSSTGLAVAASQMAILEEEALRLAGSLTGHRYLFGLAIPGGLSRDFDDHALRDGILRATEIVQRMDEIEELLINTSSFLDRIEEVGIICEDKARAYGLVGPVARGSGYCKDLRKLQPYAAYDSFELETPCEKEGDGYARLRVLFAEIRESIRIMEESVSGLPNGPVLSEGRPTPGAAFAGVETPRGTSWHWIRIDEERKIRRYHPITPSFVNWHGFHLAAEDFAFQDFPIILATFGLSVAENDR